MKVVYVSPNRSHHYRYAEGLERAGLLHRFVTGFPRYSKYAGNLAVDRARVVRVDFWQTLYVASLRLRCGRPFRERLNTRSKHALDRAFCRAMREADLGLFYNGCGLRSIRCWNGRKKCFVVEAVNTHVLHQRRVLAEEAGRLGLDWGFPDEAAIPSRVAEYEETDYILVPSEAVAESFRGQGIAASKLSVNPYGLTLPAVVPKSARGAQPLTFLYVGQLNFRKGLKYLVEAFRRLPSASKRLWLVGPAAPPSGLEGMEMPDGVEFLGVRRGGSLEALYAEADIFVQPSLEEGLSLVIGEAMGSGMPVIASTATGGGEIIDDGLDGVLVEPGCVDSLLLAMKRLSESHDLRRRLGEAAMVKARAFGGWRESEDRLVEKLSQVWEDFCRRSTER